MLDLDPVLEVCTEDTLGFGDGVSAGEVAGGGHFVFPLVGVSALDGFILSTFQHHVKYYFAFFLNLFSMAEQARRMHATMTRACMARDSMVIML